MNVYKSDHFLTDVERQFEWYSINANWDIADRYLLAVEGCCKLVGDYPRVGSVAGFVHPRLRSWRYFVVFRPFQKHLLFYQEIDDRVVMRRAMHGHRNLPQALLDSPGST